MPLLLGCPTDIRCRCCGCPRRCCGQPQPDTPVNVFSPICKRCFDVKAVSCFSRGQLGLWPTLYIQFCQDACWHMAQPYENEQHLSYTKSVWSVILYGHTQYRCWMELLRKQCLMLSVQKKNNILKEFCKDYEQVTVYWCGFTNVNAGFCVFFSQYSRTSGNAITRNIDAVTMYQGTTMLLWVVTREIPLRVSLRACPNGLK